MSKQTERDAFRSRWGFILACIGSAVGMGNIWRFPYLVSAWGGMTFLLPYFLFVLLIGSTGIIGEMALGRSTRSGPIGAFGQAAALRGRRSTGEAVGYIPVLGSLALAIGYSCVVGWIFKYFALALDGGLFAMGQDMNVIVDSFNGTACGWGNNFWLVIALAVNFAIMAFGVGGGIERANKVMMPVLSLRDWASTLQRCPARATATATSLPSIPRALPTRSCGSTPSGRRSSHSPWLETAR